MSKRIGKCHICQKETELTYEHIPPYKAFMQGGITYEYGKLGILIAVNNMGV